MGEDKCHGNAGIEPGKALDLAGLVQYGEGAVVSRTLAKTTAGTLTILAFDAGEELSEHTAPFDVFVQIVEGAAELTIGGKAVMAQTGQFILMPADVPHAVRAPGRMKMLLVMFRAGG